MFRITYKSSVLLDGFRRYDARNIFMAHSIEFHGGIAYCYRSRLAYVAISEDDMIEIEDLDCPGAVVDIHASFKAKELAYDLPF